ncbi:MAG TPA: hypothetical protein VNU68_33285 [Verrucomicrobiae bacterium]|nr:hypothetical protein [Verrucomicrobiae bacterium]
MELPLAGHPGLDTPDARCDAGQSGPVWFLAAPFGTIERTCVVPVGTAVLCPMLVAECSTLEADPFHGGNEADQRDCARFWADHTFSVSTLDGALVENLETYRVSSRQFQFNAPTPWIFGETGGAGTAVGDGAFLLIKPLSKGEHVIHATGGFHFAVAEGDPFDYDATFDTTLRLVVQ